MFSSYRIRVFHGSHQIYLDKLNTGEITGAVYGLEAFINYYNLRNYRKGILRYTRDRLYVHQSVIYFRQYSNIRAINRELKYYNEHGLTRHWYSRYSRKMLDDPSKEVKAPKVLMLRNILGSLIILIGLHIFSIFVFGLELLAMRVGFIRRVVEFLIY